MMTTIVDEPQKYGVCKMEEDGRISKFVEKPKEFYGNRVNAGIYVMNTTILDKIDLRPHFLERDIFPQLAEKGQIVGL